MRIDRQFKIIFGVVLLVFSIVFIGVITVWSMVGYTIYRVAQDPAIVGRVAGEVTNDFTETVKDKAKEKAKEKVDNFKEKLLK